MQCNAIYYIVV